MHVELLPAANAERRPVQDPKIVCPEKLHLLREYVNFLSAHNNDVNQYSQLILAGIDGDRRKGVKTRADESLQQYHEARTKYVDHVREHGCDSHNEPASSGDPEWTK